MAYRKKIKISLEKLSQRFSVSGGFLWEPKIGKYRYGNKLASSSANITMSWYARAYS